MAATPTRAVRAPFITPSPKRRERRASALAADDGADEVVADRDEAGGEEVGGDEAEEAPGAEEAGVGAVGLGDAADHADVLREGGEDVGEGEGDEGGGAGDGAARGLDLAAGAGVEGLEEGALGELEDGVGVEEAVALLARGARGSSGSSGRPA